MNKKTLTKLEFYKITELLMNEATTPVGSANAAISSLLQI